MSREGYPYYRECGECGEGIWIFYSPNKDKDYACNSKKYNDFHKCRNWKRRKGKDLPNNDKEPLPAAQINSAAEMAEFEATFRIKKLEVNIIRKCSPATLPLPQYENLSFHSHAHAEVEPGADIQAIYKQLFLEANQAIKNAIAEAREELGG